MAVTDFAALAVSASLSLSLCMSLSGSFILLLPCYTALSPVTASQDLILTLLPQCFTLLLHPYTLSPRSWVLAFHFSLLASLTVSSPLPASLLLFKGAHTGLGNPALYTTSRCGLFLTNPANPRLRNDTVINSHTLSACACTNMHGDLTSIAHTYTCVLTTKNAQNSQGPH